MGATLHDEPTVRDFQDNFFEIAKSEFYRGMAAGTHHLDLIRAAMDMMIYLVMQGRGEAVVFGNQAAMYVLGGVSRRALMAFAQACPLLRFASDRR